MIKNKNFIEKLADRLSQAGIQAGIIVMAAATVTGILELPSHQDSRAVLPNQAVLAFAGNNLGVDNPLRREKESTETSTVQISYRATQRTPARSIQIK